ncbi:AraC-type DNA-binding protein [Butyrivibrio sp. ob235]|uniref:GH39 family glycosyl hydrolase n=1 Tax=Butyrivibrio sp. ob235 TaxID=1761780 RepID=UPI0008D88111|nr:helix-turn-helix domain-containing protein [Butyrivibrio sp. ob235]SEL22087.1 AraC-type DNA-binding protein [Butyrivibrio sp. ob235]
MNFDTCSYEIVRPEKNEKHIIMSLTLLFAIEGSATVNVLEDSFVLNEGDVVMINPGVEYSFGDVGESIVGRALFSMKMIGSVMKGKNVLFYCNSVADKSKSYEDLRNIFYHMTEEYLYGSRQSDCRIDSNLYLILDTLIENYQTQNLNEAQGNPDNDVRMQQMMQYIIGNLDQEVNLTELAESMYVSASTLSRIFKKNTGVYFADYVTRLRLQQSLLLLSSTDQNMTQIALSCGFTNSSSFNRAFRKEMNMSPSQYRELHSEDAKKEEDEKKKIDVEIREKLENNVAIHGGVGVSDSISVDLTENDGEDYEKIWNRMLNIGSVNDLTRANMQYHTEYLHDKLHFDMARIWTLFSTKLMITDGSGRKACNFNMVDIALDFLVRNHIKVFLSLGRKPDMAAMSTGEIYKMDDYIPFVSRKAWETAVSEFFNHIVDRYGLKEVSDWIFELSSIPILQEENIRLWQGDSYSVQEAYDFLYKTVKRKIPDAMVGGFGGTVEDDWEQLRSLYLSLVAKDETPDFVSFLLFPYVNSVDDEGNYDRRVCKDPENELRQVRQIRELMEQSGLSDSKLFITEWNISISNRNYVNDSCFRASYIAGRAEKLLGHVDALSIMSSTDWISNYMDTTGLLNGSIGLISTDRILKPAYYSFAFLNALGHKLLAHGDHYIITKTDNGSIRMLLFNDSWFSAGYFLGPEEVPLERMGSGSYTVGQALELSVTIRHLQGTGNWYIKRRILNRNHGSILDEWQKFQYETRLTRSDVKYLESISVPKLTLEKAELEDSDHSILVNARLEPHEVCMIHIFSMD